MLSLERAIRISAESFAWRLCPGGVLAVPLVRPYLSILRALEDARAGCPTFAATLGSAAFEQCPLCCASESTVKAVRQKYSDRVRLIFVDFPLSSHNHAMQAANAARCAGEQGKFWRTHDALFADQGKPAPADLKAAAKKLGLDTAKIDACFDQRRYEDAIKKDTELGRKL